MNMGVLIISNQNQDLEISNIVNKWIWYELKNSNINEEKLQKNK